MISASSNHSHYSVKQQLSSSSSSNSTSSSSSGSTNHHITNNNNNINSNHLNHHNHINTYNSTNTPLSSSTSIPITHNNNNLYNNNNNQNQINTCNNNQNQNHHLHHHHHNDNQENQYLANQYNNNQNTSNNIQQQQQQKQQQQAQQLQSSLITKSMTINNNTNNNNNINNNNSMKQPQQPQQQQNEQPIIVKETIQNGHQTTIREYRQGEFLGKGGFAKCYLMTQTETNRVYAAKIVPKSTLQKPRARSKLKTEIRIHSSLDHENIVKFHHCFENEENVYILLGLCNQKTVMDLHKRRKFLLEAEVKYYVYQVIQAVQYLHQHKIIHRDLKLGNLFIDNMRIKLGDFGLSTRVEHEGERKKTICGTPNYIAPEVLDNSNGHSYEVDIWSIGIILYTLLIGKPPFETPDVRNTYQRIKMNQYSFPDEPVISESARSLIISILNPIPEKRPNLNQLLSHDFFCLSTIPQYLPVSALTTTPTSLIRSSVPLSENTNIINQQQQQQQYQLTSPTKQIQKQLTSPHKSQQQQQQQQLITVPQQQQHKELEKDDFHYRKLRRLEKMKENDLKTKMLKQKLTTPPADPNQQQAEKSQSTIDDQCSNVKELETKIANNHITEPVTKRESFNGFPSSLVYIAQFADLSHKYGLGYFLSNGSVGAYFNDSTKIISFIDSGIAHYMEHAKGTEGDGRRILDIKEDHPHDTQKKVTLINYFANHFNQQPVKFTNNNNNNQTQNNNNQNPSVYVKKWIKTARGIAFRLSDKTIQVNFYDKSIIIITKDQMVTYVASDETTIKTDQLGNFFKEMDAKIVSRIKYTKEIIMSLYQKKPDQ